MLVTDAPCMVRPIMHQRCRHLLENGGVLPRVGPEHETNNTGDSAGTATGLDGMPNTPPLELGAVSIPALANMGANAHPISGCEPMLEAIDLQRDEAVADVYDLFRRASASVPVQRGVDFFCLLDAAAENSPGDGWAVELRNTVVNSWELMHEIGYYFLSLYEAALVQMECCRLTATRLKALQDNPDTSRSSGGGGVRGHGVEWGRKMSDPCTGATRGIGGEGGSGGGRRGGSGSKMLHWRDAERRGEFLRKVLATAAGATKLSGAPTLPGFFSFRGLVPDEPDGAIGGLDALIRYGEVKHSACELKRTGTTESSMHPSCVYDFAQALSKFSKLTKSDSLNKLNFSNPITVTLTSTAWESDLNEPIVVKSLCYLSAVFSESGQDLGHYSTCKYSIFIGRI